jgi:hypothetical protein
MQRVDESVILAYKVTSNDSETISVRKVMKARKVWPEAFFVGSVKMQRFYWHFEMASGKVIEVWQDEDGYSECSKVLN